MNLLIIQARMGSTRLPGKILKEINGKPILQHLVERISPAKKVNKIIIATTTNTEDDATENFCKEHRYNYYRGSDWDVLGRFYEAAQPHNPKTIIRVTADCPLHSHKVIDFAIDKYHSLNCDYFSNSNNEEICLEDGFDTEVFSFSALEEAHINAKMLSEREHVTPYIKTSGNFTCKYEGYNKNYRFKLSVDSPDDFVAVSKIFEELKDKKDFGMEEVIELLAQKPEILQLNKDSVSNAGYLKSLKEDKKIE
ncbi:MAG TPA: glycosyltransferase family protein [Bacteroidia bacterium]|jgi:spore coat polysaccharide biosynthesis protein SpsF (cytidylyltransferase family)|nr:glycosyltransferase family protein [Bacteroidia bacterium]